MRAYALANPVSRRVFCLAMTLGLLFVLLAASVHAGIPVETYQAATVLESWENFQPSDWVRQTLLTSTVEVYNEGGFHTGAWFQTAVDGIWSGWTSLGLQVTELDPTRRQLLVPNLPFAHSDTENRNQIQFRTKSALEQWLLSPVYSVRVDTQAPTSAIDMGEWYSSPLLIVGTATDAGSGVGYVEVQLQRASDAAFYTGSAWQPEATWFSASGTTSWSVPFTPTVQSAYTVTSRAVDGVGNVEAQPTTDYFGCDLTPPETTILTTGHYRADSWPGDIAGLTVDEDSGLALVQLQLQRSLDNRYYDGLNWTVSVTWITPTGTTSWSLPFVPTIESAYTVTVHASDHAGNTQYEPELATFTYDTTEPQSLPSTAGCFDIWTGVITGTASDNMSGVAVVHATIQRASDSLYFNGIGWASSPYWLTTAGTDPWALSFATTKETIYEVASRATDKSGNVQTIPGVATFTFDISPPQSTISTTGNLNAWSGAITGSARDTSSGVGAVRILVQRLPDLLYYNGFGWVAAPAWITASGTTSWSVPFSPPFESTYFVSSLAFDHCGNAQLTPTSGSFTYDFTPPQSSPATSGYFNSWPGLLQGTASDAASGLAVVQLNIQRHSDRRYYNGTSWVVSSTWISATGTTAWSLPFTPSVESAYTLTSRAVDICGNAQVDPGKSTFVYDVTPPEAASSLDGCYAAWGGLIQGTALDLVSGVDNVQVKLQRASDGQYYNGTSWTALSSWLVVSSTQTWSFAFTPTVQTIYTVTVTAVDRCGNAQTIPDVRGFAFDTTPPSSEVGTTGYLGSFDGTIAGTANDATSGVELVQIQVQRAADQLYYTGSTWAVSSRWLTATGTTAWSLPFTPTIETTFTVTSRALDRCGNTQITPHVAFFVFDTVAPLSPFNLYVSPASWTPQNSFTITWTSLQDLSGIAAVHFKWDAAPLGNGDESPGSPVVGEGIHTIPGIVVPSEGAHQLFLWLEDRAGNVNYQTRNATSADAFRWDATSPGTSLVGIDALTGCDNWYASSVRIDLLAADVNPDPAHVNLTSGISATLWRQDGGPWQTVTGSAFEITDQGTHLVEYFSEDVAGNREATRIVSPTIRIDAMPPSTSPPSYTGTLGPNDWYRSPVSVSLTAMDATSGVSATMYQVNTDTVHSGTSFVVAAEGRHTLRYWSVDLACNQEAVHTVSLSIDRTYPSTTHSLEGSSGDNGWFTKSPVTVTLAASDAVTGVLATSGVESLRYRVDGGPWQVKGISTTFVLSIPSSQSICAKVIEYYATDTAGNSEPIQRLTIGVDNLAPLALPFRPYVSPSGWTNVNCFDIRWYQNPDDCSGIAGAYYSFTVPVSPTDGTLFLGEDLTAIPCVQVPDGLGDGLRNVYVWLRDKAGNSDHLTSHSATVALDRTAPQISSQLSGIQCGTAGWYNSPITVTFVTTDSLSGMAGGVISYQVNGGGWIQSATYTEYRDGRYVVEGRARDTAGNTTDVVTQSIKLDRTAPDAPSPIWVEPSDWSRTNQFFVQWANPFDLSGLGGVYYKLGSPPNSPSDGTYRDGTQTSITVETHLEGAVPVYVWLADKACNANYALAAMATLRYDVTAPATTFTAIGVPGGDGWYTSPITVMLNCADAHSGCGQGRTHYQIADGPWITGTSFAIADERQSTFSYYSVDLAGNVETTRTATIGIDRTPPSSHAFSDSSSSSTSFTVRWDGSDAASGIASFDVQYRVGASGTWQDWATGIDPLQRSKLFNGSRGYTYYFRTRAIDKAGNAEPYPAIADTYVAVDPLINGDLEREIGPEWQLSGRCVPTRIIAPSHSGDTTHAIVLGCPDPNEAGLFGESMICQTVNIPRAVDMPGPVLLFRYHIFTYDVIWGSVTQMLYDSFHVGLAGAGDISPTYVFTDGNPGPDYGSLIDMGWRQGAVDLRPYAGQTMKVCLANVTRIDGIYNTWTIVDDARLMNLEYRVAVPIVQRSASAQSASAQGITSRPHREPER